MTKKIKHFFEIFSARVTKATGKPLAFILAVVVIIAWAVTGPVFHFSDTWQLVINTGTTIITFLMVFVIQQSQNKDTMALQIKLNELIAARRGPSFQGRGDVGTLTGSSFQGMYGFGFVRCR